MENKKSFVNMVENDKIYNLKKYLGDKNMTIRDEIIDMICEIAKKYGFEYLSQDDNMNEVSLSYEGNDLMEHKDCDEDFETWKEYLDYAYANEEITNNHFEEAFKEIKKIVNINEWYNVEGMYYAVFVIYEI